MEKNKHIVALMSKQKDRRMDRLRYVDIVELIAKQIGKQIDKVGGIR